MGWAVAQTYGSYERTAITHLQRQGFHALFPIYTQASKSNTSKLLERPLFPCYIFIELDLNSRWSPINSTTGIIRLITSRDKINPKPLFVPDTFMEGLGILSQKESFRPLINPGTVVRVKKVGNAFYDIVGKLVELDKNYKAIVLMSIFNREMEVKFSIEDLEEL